MAFFLSAIVYYTIGYSGIKNKPHRRPVRLRLYNHVMALPSQ